MVAYDRNVGHDVSDEGLVQATIKGDGKAYAILFERHHKAVRTTVRGHLRDLDAVDDAVQDAFTQALYRLDSLRDHSRFRPWLLAIARNSAVNHRRKNTKVTLVPIDEAGGEGTVAISENLGPETEVELRELANLVRGGVADLTKRDATAISMVLWLGVGPQEVGEAFGITTGAAKVLLHRARHRLRNALIVQMAAASRDFDCETLVALVQRDEILEAAKHVKDCFSCLEASKKAVGLTD